MKKIVVCGFLFFVCYLFGQQTAPTGEQSSEHFKIKFDKTLTPATVKQVQDSLEARYALYQKELKIPTSGKISVRLVANSERFRIEAKGSVFDDGDYLGGVLLLSAGLVTTDAKKFHYVVVRTVVTAMTAQLNACPRWLGAAYGLYVGNEIQQFTQFSPRQMFAFSDIDEEFDRASKEREIKGVYSALGTTIQFLVGKFGERRVQQVFSQFNKGLTVEEAFERVFGENIEDLEREWQRTLSAKRK